MKTAISIPNNIFNKAEKLAHSLGITRSRLFTLALKEYLKENENSEVTKKLNEIYSNEKNNIDDEVINAQVKSIISYDEEW